MIKLCIMSVILCFAIYGAKTAMDEPGIPMPAFQLSANIDQEEADKALFWASMEAK